MRLDGGNARAILPRVQMRCTACLRRVCVTDEGKHSLARLGYITTAAEILRPGGVECVQERMDRQMECQWLRTCRERGGSDSKLTSCFGNY